MEYLELVINSCHWLGMGWAFAEDGWWIDWTKDVVFQAARQEEKRRFLDVVKEGRQRTVLGIG